MSGNQAPTIGESFGGVARQYDRQRRRLIPCYDDFYRLPVTCLDYSGSAPEVLDLGAGTGLFSAFLLERYPKASLTLVDLSQEMLAVARQRFAGRPNLRTIVGDYAHQIDYGGRFDIVLSSLSIHHLSHKDKQALYRQVHHDLLREGGVFLNADQALSPTPETEALFKGLWMEAVNAAGLTEGEREAAYRRLSYDNPSTMADQLAWLAQAGFAQVDCVYKYYHFCCFYARKAGGGR